MAFGPTFGVLGPESDGGQGNGATPRYGMENDPPGTRYEFRVDNQDAGTAEANALGRSEWRHANTLDNSRDDSDPHTIEVTRTTPDGESETNSWDVVVNEDSSARQAENRELQDWDSSGRADWLEGRSRVPNTGGDGKERARRPVTGPLTGGGGGGAGELVTAGAGGTGVLTGTAEKGNAQPSVEKGNAA